MQVIRARKDSLVNYGFRLPSARENRPLKFPEFERLQNQVLYVSATPAKYELGMSQNVFGVEQIIRPTGLVDPEIIIKPVKGQVDHLLGEIKRKVKDNQRVLVTTLTKKNGRRSHRLLRQGRYQGQISALRNNYPREDRYHRRAQKGIIRLSCWC